MKRGSRVLVHSVVTLGLLAARNRDPEAEGSIPQYFGPASGDGGSSTSGVSLADAGTLDASPLGCNGDTACALGNLCVDGACTPGCRTTRDCPTGRICQPSLGRYGTCVECTVASDCPTGHICENHSCSLHCQSDGECAGKYCDSSTGACVDCVEDSHCGVAGRICKAHQCVDGCRRDEDCSPGHCDPSRGDGVCVPCTDGSHCLPGHDCVNNQCEVHCTSDAQCAPLACNTASGRCMECVDNTDCPLGQVCHNHSCQSGCLSDRDCSAPRVCDTAVGTPGQCVECTVDAQCNGRKCAPNQVCVECLSSAHCTNPDKPICMASTQSCVQCQDTNDCSPGSVCDGLTYLCRTPLLLCDARECTSNNDCPTGSTCTTFNGNSSKRCRVPCTAYGSCDLFQRGNECSTTGEQVCGCKDACRSNADCPYRNPCQTSTGRCIECSTDMDCRAGAICRFDMCTACQSNNECGQHYGEDRPFCSSSTGVCVECLGDAQCSGSKPHCSILNGACVACTSDSQCPGSKPRCTVTNACVECLGDTDCGTGKRCSWGSCAP